MNTQTKQWSPDVYVKAYEFAAERHNGQMVPGSTLPYITHVSLVSVELLHAIEDCDDPDFAVQTALLHDVLEDTETAYDELVSRFGVQVADAVLALTKDRNLPKSEQMADSIARVKRQPRDIWIVKMADRIVNLRQPPVTWTTEKKHSYLASSTMIHEELRSASDALGERLAGKIREYRAYV